MSLPVRWASRTYQGHNHHIPGTTAYLRSRTFQSYFNMITRCHYERHPRYSDYGGRGITVSSKWVDSFDAFIQDMGERPIGYSLDRIDPNGPYCKSNCRWADNKTQATNKRANRSQASGNRKKVSRGT